VAQRRNPISTPVSSSAPNINVFTAPLSGFSYVYKIALTASGATNLLPQMFTASGQYVSLAGGPGGGFDLTQSGSALYFADTGNSPWYTIDPGAVFQLNNSGSANIQGSVLWSV
jgi:hypothetical protein